MTRESAGEFNYVYTNVSFTVTNRTRAVPKYRIVPLPNGTVTTPVRINNKGQVVGHSGGKAFLYDGEFRSLGTLGGDYSSASAINNNGQIVGVAEDGEGIRRPFLWEAERGMQRVPINGDGAPADINDLGDVVGNGPAGGFLFSNGRDFTVPVAPWDVNNRGWVVGGGVHNTGLAAPWNEFLRLYRPVFGEDGVDVSVVGINDANEVTGSDKSVVGGGRWAALYAFRYSAFKRVRVSPRAQHSYARAINRMGDIVGWT